VEIMIHAGVPEGHSILSSIMPDKPQPHSPSGRPVGHLFTKVYRDRGEPRHDDPKFRVQLYHALWEIFSKEYFALGRYIAGQTGVEVPSGQGTMGIYYRFDEYINDCPLDDLLDLLTHVVNFAETKGMRSYGYTWIDRVRAALDTHNMAYEMDRLGGMHHKVDAAFARSRELTLTCLADAKFEAARVDTEAAFDCLTDVHQNTKMAVVNIFLAAECVFKLVLGKGIALTAGGVGKDFRFLVQDKIAGCDQAATQSYNALVSSFASWVDACHPYRHGQKDPNVVEPPMDLAIVLTTQGADLIRWLVSMS
jgi:hypothetical protein